MQAYLIHYVCASWVGFDKCCLISVKNMLLNEKKVVREERKLAFLGSLFCWYWSSESDIPDAQENSVVSRQMCWLPENTSTWLLSMYDVSGIHQN